MRIHPRLPPIISSARGRCASAAALSCRRERGETRHFTAGPRAARRRGRRVAAVTRRRYPDLDVPFHSRWRHFSAGGVDRAAAGCAGRRPGRSGAGAARSGDRLGVARCRRRAGLAYREAETGLGLARSEGLAVASLRAMQTGLFSAQPRQSVAGRRGGARGADRRSGSARRFSTGRTTLAGLQGRAALLRRSARSRRAPESSARRRGSAIFTITGCRGATACRRRTCCALSCGARPDLAGPPLSLDVTPAVSPEFEQERIEIADNKYRYSPDAFFKKPAKQAVTKKNRNSTYANRLGRRRKKGVLPKASINRLSAV